MNPELIIDDTYRGLFHGDDSEQEGSLVGSGGYIDTGQTDVSTGINTDAGEILGSMGRSGAMNIAIQAITSGSVNPASLVTGMLTSGAKSAVQSSLGFGGYSGYGKTGSKLGSLISMFTGLPSIVTSTIMGTLFEAIADKTNVRSMEVMRDEMEEIFGWTVAPQILENVLDNFTLDDPYLGYLHELAKNEPFQLSHLAIFGPSFGDNIGDLAEGDDPAGIGPGTGFPDFGEFGESIGDLTGGDEGGEAADPAGLGSGTGFGF